ncbi:MAG TPA: hypothetical protein VFX59_10625 [Polyangiales bacterium]|nr:hypothetical protein [Polyangiales bacterium]
MVRTLTAIAVVGLMAGCSDEDKPSEERDDDTVETDDTPTSDASKPKPDGSVKRDAAPTRSGDASVEDPPGEQPASDASRPSEQPAKPFDYEDETVELKKDLVIPAGKTVRVGPGTTFHANGDYKVQVDGTLQVEGSADKPSAFTGGGSPSSWHGIVVSSGGKLELSHAQISGAKYGFFAEAGSDFTVTDSVLDTSFKTAVVYSDGSFTNTVFKASIPPTIAITDAVAVDDPNGSLTIIDASPTIKNCEFAGASPFTDLVRIGGNASPTFDFVYLHDAHCAFHTNGGVNTSPRITNALIKGFSYGFMAYTTKPIVEDSVFENNGSDFGLCNGATEANAPALKNNFYKAGEVSLDASCFRIKTVDAAPAASANPKAGVSGL